MKAILFHNSKAGEGHPDRNDLVTALQGAGYDVASFDKKSGAEFAAEVAKAPALVVMAGGDGTVATLLGYLGGVTSPVAILPMGTSNNVARSFGIEGDPIALISQLADAPEKRLDVGLANGPWGARLFIESVGWGLIANLTGNSVEGDSVPERRIRMRAALVQTLKNAKPQRMKIVVDGEPLEDQFLMVEVSNMPRVGPGLALAEDRKLGTDKLALITLAPEDRDSMIDWVTDDEDMPPVKVRMARSVTVMWHRQPMRIDDEVEGKSRDEAPVLLRKLPVNLRLKVPARAGAS